MSVIISSVHVIYTAALFLLSIPVLVFFSQILFSLISWRQKNIHSPRGSIAILMPAHNESLGIAAALLSVKSQLLITDRLVVVADNCTDDTAAVARLSGAEVIERFNAFQRGKGYALDFGVRYLEKSPPETVIIVDADCLVHPEGIARISQECKAFDRPIQALYLMKSPLGANLKSQIAEFAWTVRNWVRPLGYHRLNLPCQLMGTGMAFPWELIKSAELASGHIVEDMKLGIDCARLGKAPKFCPDALVTSTFPVSAEGVTSQRTRWEHGHLAMILKEGLPLLIEGILKLNKNLFFMALDICIPPLAMLVLLILLISSIGVAFAFVTQSFYPWIFAWYIMVSMLIAVLLAWAKFARRILSLKELMYAPIYVLRKIPIYITFIVKRQVEWVRSKRD